jgi:hypothetical protein
MLGIFVRQRQASLPTLQRLLSNFLWDFKRRTLGKALSDPAGIRELTFTSSFANLLARFLRSFLAFFAQQLARERECLEQPLEDADFQQVEARLTGRRHEHLAKVNRIRGFTLIDSGLLFLCRAEQILGSVLG